MSKKSNLIHLIHEQEDFRSYKLITMAVKKSNTKFWKVLFVFRCMFKFRKLKRPVTLSYVYNTTDRMKTACVEALLLQQNQSRYIPV